MSFFRPLKTRAFDVLAKALLIFLAHEHIEDRERFCNICSEELRKSLLDMPAEESERVASFLAGIPKELPNDSIRH